MKHFLHIPDIQVRYKNFMVTIYQNIEQDSILYSGTVDYPDFLRVDDDFWPGQVWHHSISMVVKGRFEVNFSPTNKKMTISEGHGASTMITEHNVMQCMEKDSKFICLTNLKPERWYDRNIIHLEQDDTIEIPKIDNAIEHYIFPANQDMLMGNKTIRHQQITPILDKTPLTIRPDNYNKMFDNEKAFVLHFWRTENNEPWNND